MQSQQTPEEASDPLMNRSATTLALLAVFTIGAFLVSLVGPTVAAAQEAPADQAPTTVAPAPPTPTTVVPPTTSTGSTGDTTIPTTVVPPATTLTMPSALTPAPEGARPEAGTRGPRNMSEATYVYTPREVKRAWNNSHSAKITLAKATKLAAYMNAVVANQLQQYLLAVYLNAVANATVPGQAGWERVAACESGGNWGISSGNGYYGGLQFSLSTWRSTGGTGYPHQNSKAEQMRRANILKARAGLGQWPHCGGNFHG